MGDFIELPNTKLSLSLRKLVFEKGVNDAEYIVQPTINGKQSRCPYYLTWNNMLRRCYDPKYQRKQPTYIGCTVCDSWLIFSIFKTWMVQQDWEGNQLDKDLLVKGNKEYSAETCIFISKELNILFNDHKNAKGLYPTGVSWKKHAKKYQAQCSVKGKITHLGYYNTQEEASKRYRDFKKELIFKIACEQSNVKIKEALLRMLYDY